MQRPAQHGPRSTAQTHEIKPPARIERTQPVEPALEGRIILLQQFPGSGRTGDGIPPGRPFPPRQDVTPHPVALVNTGRVGGVLPPTDSRHAQSPGQLLVPQSEQRTKMHPAADKGLHRTGRREAAGATSAGQPHEHGLGHIIALMPEPQNPRVPSEKLQPRLARLGFAGPGAPSCPGGGHEAQPELGANPAAERGIRPRRGPAQTVIEVQDDQTPTAPGPKRPYEQDQRKRVGAAGKCEAPAGAARTRRPRHHRRIEALARKDRGQRLRPFTQR